MDQEIYPGDSQEQDRMPAGQPEAPAAPAAPQEQDRMTGASKSDFIGRLKSQKWLLFSAFGLVGGMAGTLLSLLTPGVGDEHNWQVIIEQVIWTALTASLLTGSLFVANDFYERRRLSPRVFSSGVLIGILAGAVSGGVAQAIFNMRPDLEGWTGAIVQALCWGVMGGLLGAFLSRAMANFGAIKGALGGFIGGTVGGLIFLIVVNAITDLLPGSSKLARETFGLMIGVGILGASLGFVMVVVEKIFREASLEVVWSPNESSFFNLGSQPIYIGGGRDDEIYIRGLGERHSHVVFADGAVEYVDAESQKRTPLRNESSIQVGPLKLVIHAAA
ncbi:MAG: hypothetical protein ACPGVU_18400 [Limisphaerales bacterium]